MLICGFGCAALGELVPQIVPVAKYIGAAYVLYLAYKTLIRKTGSGTADASRPLTCGNGFLLQFLGLLSIPATSCPMASIPAAS